MVAIVLQIKDKQGQQALDMKQLLDQHRNNSIIEGVEASISSGLTLSCTSGRAIVNGSEVSVSSQSITLDAADSSLPRKDLITVASDGTLKKYTGTPEERRREEDDGFDLQRPVPPDLSSMEEPVVAEVFLPAGATSIQSQYLRDRRVFNEIYTQMVNIFDQPSSQSDAVTKVYSDAQFTLHESEVSLGPEESLTMDRFVLPAGKVIQVTGGNVYGTDGELEVLNRTDGVSEYIFTGAEIDVGDPLFRGAAGDEIEIRLVNVNDTSSTKLTGKISYNIIDQ